ncbi:Acetate--CoA ligase [ADP-forming] II subunit alpha [uncultured archaeon]|nr:Acetate--CoA ligase [ADP-forming] II subunit alpha [uncultured archaeon]
MTSLPRLVRNLDAVFKPSSVAVIGASHEPTKIGHVILRNFLEGGYGGKVYAVNPHTPDVLGVKTLKRASDAPGKIDCALVAVPEKYVQDALEDSIHAGARAAVVITGGFSEVGNKSGEERIRKLAIEHDLALIGPNCMGVLNPSARVDSVFLPIYKMGRPHAGGISFISQSGAVGGCIVDLAARAGVGMSKFVSYGNATVINESHLLSYLAADPSTQAVVSYMEGVKDGPHFMESARLLTKNKPLVVLKAGKSKQGAAAAASHTGSLAGSAEVYSAAFAQAGAVEAQTLEELFDFAKIFALPPAAGARVGILTNGGGNGVLAVDSTEAEGLKLAEFSPATLSALKSMLPAYATAHNPMDIIGDADSARYEQALSVMMKDPNIDVLVVIVLFQTAALDSSVVNVLVKAAQQKTKPVVVVSTGGEYTELHRRILDGYGIPTYPSPSSALRAVSRFLQYQNYRCRYHPSEPYCKK